MPAGKGHRYFSSGVSSYALGGWKLSAVVSALSGLPFTITTASATGGTTQTVNQIAPYQVTHGVSSTGNTRWFNPASFTTPATCTPYTPANPVACAVGNTQRNQFRGPGYFSDNLSLFKSFPIFREAALEARFDAFNMTNTPAFGLPNTAYANTITNPNSSFGRITSTLGSGTGNVNGVGGPRVLQAGVKIAF